MTMSSRMPESLRVRWEPSVNLGHLLIVLGMFASVFGAYSDVQRTNDTQELRIARLEEELGRASAEAAVFRAEVRTTLQRILNDLAVLKYDEERRRGRERSEIDLTPPEEPWAG